MGRRLAGYVPIHDGDRTVWYGPGDEIPADVAEKIGDHAWIEDDEPVDDAAAREAAERAEREAAEKAAREAEERAQRAASAGGPPPLAGQGSSTEAWAQYAAALEVQVLADAKRDDIVAAVRDAGYPVEQ